MKTFAMIRRVVPAALFLLFLIPALGWAGNIAGQRFGGTDEIVLTFAATPDQATATNPQSYSVHEEADPDIRLDVTRADLGADGRSVTLKFAAPLNTLKPHVVAVSGLGGESVRVAKSYLGYLFGILVSALLINNFVFTKYLGLCVFFGTSKRKDTAKGMGFTFLIVMVVSAIMSWFFYQFILKPFQLNFLQIVVFIGLVSLTVQAVDTVLRKVNPVLFNSFGVYLVLVIANCVILAVDRKSVV